MIQKGTDDRVRQIKVHTHTDNMHIVVAVNESEPSLYAFDWMIENILKESKNHKLSILTVVEPPVQAGYYYAASGGKYIHNNIYFSFCTL